MTPYAGGSYIERASVEDIAALYRLAIRAQNLTGEQMHAVMAHADKARATGKNGYAAWKMAAALRLATQGEGTA